MKNSDSALVIIAHGSRRAQSNAEVKKLAQSLSTLDECSFGQVRAAFLEIAEPSIVDGLQQCVNAGATTITVFPYFLSAGRHVAEDIPAEVSLFQQNNPQITVVNIDYLGLYEKMPQLILSMVAGNSDRNESV